MWCSMISIKSSTEKTYYFFGLTFVNLKSAYTCILGTNQKWKGKNNCSDAKKV